MQVAMQADIRIAAENSQFGIPAAKLGIAYGYEGLKNLVSLVGPSWARLLMYTGMRIDSAEAARIGLVDRVVPDPELWRDRKSTRLNSSHANISYAVFCLKKKK